MASASVKAGSREASRVCDSTGLTLVAASGRVASRIAQSSYGPMNPEPRKVDTPRLGWGRFDVPGHRTIYSADPPEAAYAESLASLRVALGFADMRLSELFEDIDPRHVETFADRINDEWCNGGHHMPPGSVPRGWRMDRLLYTLQFPADGWFVSLETSESIAAIAQALNFELASLGLRSLTVADLTGSNREVTTTIAEWVRGLTLDDGSLPHGIVYSSKHGTNWKCWASWLRRVDDGLSLTSEPTSADQGREILDPHHNPPLAKVAELFNLVVH